jgi:hypothetical protein
MVSCVTYTVAPSPDFISLQASNPKVLDRALLLPSGQRIRKELFTKKEKAHFASTGIVVVAGDEVRRPLSTGISI